MAMPKALCRYSVIKQGSHQISEGRTRYTLPVFLLIKSLLYACGPPDRFITVDHLYFDMSRAPPPLFGG